MPDTPGGYVLMGAGYSVVSAVCMAYLYNRYQQAYMIVFAIGAAG